MDFFSFKFLATIHTDNNIYRYANARTYVRIARSDFCARKSSNLLIFFYDGEEGSRVCSVYASIAV